MLELDPSVQLMLRRKVLAPDTKSQYLKGIKCFCDFMGMPPCELVGFLRSCGKSEIVNVFREWFVYVKDRLAPKTARNWLTGVKMWLVENDVEVDVFWREILRWFRRYIGRVKPLLRRSIITRDEIAALLSVAKPRERAVISMAASSGMRIRDTLLELKLENFIDDIWNPTYSCYAIEIPENLSKTGEPYITFISNEAAQQLRLYLEIRKAKGEKITRETYLIASNKGNRKYSYSRFITNWSQLCNKAGIDRKPVRIKGQRKYWGKKAENPVIYNVRPHSLRKYFKTTCSIYGVDRMASEAMMGHTLTSFGIESIYDYCTSNLEWLRKEYLKALPGLTFLTPLQQTIPKKYHEKIREIEEKINTLIQLYKEQQKTTEQLSIKLEKLIKSKYRRTYL